MVFEHNYVQFPELTNQQLQDFGFSSPHEQITSDFFATVVKVHDGDTVTLECDFRDFAFPLRFLDVDAPELNEGGEVAAEWLRSKILGKNVWVRIDPNNRVGKYGRLLGRIMFFGMDVAEEMRHLGLVAEFGRRDEGKIASVDQMMLEVQV